MPQVDKYVIETATTLNSQRDHFKGEVFQTAIAESNKRRLNTAKQIAAAAGEVFYFTGKPCGKGHISKRYVKGSMCLQCTQEGAENWKQRNPERVKHLGRKNWLKNIYNLSIAQYEAMITAQNSLCPICLRSLLLDTPHVDHDHNTGVIRGILCGRCNKGIGALGDSSANLRRAAAYLERQR